MTPGVRGRGGGQGSVFVGCRPRLQTPPSLAPALVLLVCVLGWPRDAAAICSTRHLTLFELFERAELVAVVDVTAAPKPMRAGDVTMDVVEQLKGRPRKVAQARENGSCTAGFRAGQRALVFVGDDRLAVGFWSGYVDQPSAVLVDVMRAWRAAATDPERVAVLVDAIERGEPTLAADAAYYLADEPALVLAIDPATADRLAARTGGEQWGPEIILTRLRGPHLAKLVAAKALPKDLLRLAAQDFERITRADRLARVILTERDEWSPRRVAAMERCERLHGRRLDRFSIYNRRLDARTWRALARACKTGTPLTSRRTP